MITATPTFECAHELQVNDEQQPEPALFYRRNESYPTYLPLASVRQAERVLGSGTFDSPWVTIIRGTPSGDHTYVQVLGTPDRLVVEGGGQTSRGKWDWRATAIPFDKGETRVGPPWYSEHAFVSEILTIHDAHQLMWPGLADQSGILRQVAGLRIRLFQ